MGLLTPLLWRLLGHWWPRVAAVVMLVICIALMTHIPGRADETAPFVLYDWLSRLGLTFNMRLDGFALMMAIVVSGIGTGVLSYASGYMHGHPRAANLVAWLLIFMSSMLGVVLADNLLFLFVCWELTSITSFMLIGFNHESAESRVGAKNALLITALGGLALLGGAVLLGLGSGTWQLSEMPAMHEHAWATPALLLILLAAATKSAQWPFSFWLPGAMAAPTPVSAYLHSATMVKAGVFLLARMHPVLGQHSLWTPLLIGLSAATMLLVILAVIRSTDLKALLAYSTVGALALMVGLIGIGTPKALTAMAVFLLAHACYKGCLFMVAGSIDHGVHSRDVDKLGGLWGPMPWTIGAGFVAALSMIGLGPKLGFIGKEMALEASLYAGLWPFALLTTVLAMTFTWVACLVILKTGWGPDRELAEHAHEADWSMRLPMAVLAGLGLLPVLVPGFVGLIAEPATAGLGVEPAGVHLWHGFNLALLLSVLALIGGWLAYKRRQQLLTWWPRLPAGKAINDAIWHWIIIASKVMVRVVQNGSLTAYVGMTVLAGVVVLLLGWLQDAPSLASEFNSPIRPMDVVLSLLIVGGAIATALAQRRLPAVVALSAVGSGVTMFFIAHLAPDLALTQFLVETLTVVLLVVAFRHLPNFRITRSRRRRLFHAGIALTVGCSMTILTLVGLSAQYQAPISQWHGEHSLALGKGGNVVNVILVDFRAFDTLGEITVLGIAALGLTVLMGRLRIRRPAAESGEGDDHA